MHEKTHKCRFFVNEKGSCVFATPFQKPPAMQVVNSFSFKPCLYYTKKLLCAKLNVRLATVYKVSKKEDIELKNQSNDTFSLAHTRWKCQYHIVFTPKYHRKIIYGELRADIGKILRELCDRKHIEIIEAHAMPDHIHMLVSIPPNEKVSEFMGYLKGKSTIIIFERYAHMKYKVGNRHFWSRGYYVSTVGGNKQAVQKYIQNQESEDLISNQISMVEYYDPFKKWLESNSKKKDKKKK